jgi:hypothetical protein
VRAEWDRVAQANAGIRITEEAQAGTVISARLLGIADEVQAGTLSSDAAVTEATALIRENTR